MSGPSFGFVIGAQTKAGQPGGATQLQVLDQNGEAIPVSRLIKDHILKGKGKPVGIHG